MQETKEWFIIRVYIYSSKVRVYHSPTCVYGLSACFPFLYVVGVSQSPWRCDHSLWPCWSLPHIPAVATESMCDPSWLPVTKRSWNTLIQSCNVKKKKLKHQCEILSLIISLHGSFLVDKPGHNKLHLSHHLDKWFLMQDKWKFWYLQCGFLVFLPYYPIISRMSRFWKCSALQTIHEQGYWCLSIKYLTVYIIPTLTYSNLF